jgi:hypothetical protein
MASNRRETVMVIPPCLCPVWTDVDSPVESFDERVVEVGGDRVALRPVGNGSPEVRDSRNDPRGFGGRQWLNEQNVKCEVEGLIEGADVRGVVSAITPERAPKVWRGRKHAGFRGLGVFLLVREHCLLGRRT